MKNYFSAVGISLLLAAGTGALAHADGIYTKSVKDAPIEVPCCETNWTGFFVAGSFGYAAATTEIRHRTSIGAASSRQSNDISSDDVIGTIGGGYDRQYGNYVLGVFGDYTFGNLKGSGTLTSSLNGFIQPYNLKFEDSWAVGARLGYAHSCCTMFFVTAGYTQTEIELNETANYDKELSGFFVGGGVEQKLKGGFSMKLEYRYSDYEDVTLFSQTTTVCGETCTQRIKADADTHAIRIGLAYKFGGEQVYAPLK